MYLIIFQFCARAVLILKNYVPSALKKSIYNLGRNVIEVVAGVVGSNGLIMIITNNESLLRTKCDNVTYDESEQLIKKLEMELDIANKLGKNGIGLAAPQIGIFKKAAIIRLGDVSINLVNANIEKGFDETLFSQEGCLSFPGRSEDTMRYQEVYVANNLVYPNSFVATGLIAVICQHEIDHYSGKLFIDRIIKKSPTSSKTKIGPNDMCLCGSNKKFKKCCGKNERRI